MHHNYRKTKFIYRSLVLLSSSTLEELFFFFPSAWFVADDGDPLLGEEGLEPDFTLKVIDLGWVVACVVGANRGGEGKWKMEKSAKGKKNHPLPNPPSFSLSPNPLPLSTPATWATGKVAVRLKILCHNCHDPKLYNLSHRSGHMCLLQDLVGPLDFLH